MEASTVTATAVAVARPGTESFMWGAPNSWGITGIPRRMGAWMVKLWLTVRQERYMDSEFAFRMNMDMISS
ncbi:hypothetical protein GCM10023084_75830 [Streptomyces lacrimifluminis]|uniref:Uncharacterized protein n=1 Tax=Streptomyces lacrimifluminis TaxID=1500077 RepID=A0A917P7Z4_9ACTN|nr:hypothetical protein GCM10012282_73550 [Streptomyces lacrimifluminis]